MLGVLLYILAGLSAFGAKPVPFVIVTLTFIGGLGTLVLGYVSVIIIGGMLSLRIAEFNLTLRIDKDLDAISNTPIGFLEGKCDKKIVSFQKTKSC